MALRLIWQIRNVYQLFQWLNLIMVTVLIPASGYLINTSISSGRAQSPTQFHLIVKVPKPSWSLG